MPPNHSRWACAGTKRISIRVHDDEDDSMRRASSSDGMITVFRRERPTAAAHHDDVTDDDTCGGGGRGGRSSSSSAAAAGGAGAPVEEDRLHVLVTDGTRTFYDGVTSKDIRHMSSDDGDDILGKVAFVLLRPDDETFKCSYRRVEGQLLFGGGGDEDGDGGGRRDRAEGGGGDDSDDAATRAAWCVRAKVSKLCLNNTVRPAWEGRLVDVRDVPLDDLPSFARSALGGGADVGAANRSAASASCPPSSGGLAFSLVAGDAVNALRRRVEELRARNAELEGDALRWKSTAERLGGRWEDEKGELTSRFLALLNEHKARHVKKLGGGAEDRRSGRDDGGATAAPASAGALSDGHRRVAAGREAEDRRRSKGALLPDCVDEHDYASYDDDMVDRLASGPRVGGKKRKAAAPASRDEFSRGAAPPGGGGGSGFVNPHTGATEFTDPREMFSSSSDED